MIPVKGHSGLFRDPRTGAIINKDNTNANAAKQAEVKFKESQDRLYELENDVKDIKDLLNKLLKKKK